MYDVAVIGAGVVGALIARELAHTEAKVILIEAGKDVAWGASRANSGIVHAGFAARPGSLMAELNLEGNRLYGPLCEELGVPFRRIGSLVCADDPLLLRPLQEKGARNGVELSLWDASKLSREEPNLRASAALFAPTAGIVSPYELVFQAVRSALRNGVRLLTDAPVTRIDTPQRIRAGEEWIEARVVVNAAGLYADEVAALVGDAYAITARKGEYLLLDRSEGTLVRHTIFPLPTETSKGILVSPTASGNLLLGPTATPAEKGDTSTSYEGLQIVLSQTKKLVPGIDPRKVIANFAGLRAVGGEDFVIERSQNGPWIHLVGIQSPGLTAAPAIAKRVVAMLREQLPLATRPFSASPSQKFPKDAIVCRCEGVGRSEVLQAIADGATTLDGIKLRTRAGMGRCQGGTCRTKLAFLLADALGVPVEQVLKREGPLLGGRT
ncbi:MAG: NAD(P)/FAD-dependent oxidoreductase [Bacteroidota bacterium]